MVVGPKEYAERMLLVVAGQLQVYEVSSRSECELTLSVVGDGTAGGANGPRAPLDARPAHTGPRALGGVRHRARRPGGARACQLRGRYRAGAHAGRF
jgi:hypothetical protein